ncbi:MAG TPA: nitroreductase [Marinilabiliales bacterium]|nr:nitroreductase [Marinilabiliales bacterium]
MKSGNDMEILKIIQERYSPRAFSDQTVDMPTLEYLFDAARRAPSSRNEQPWKFIYAIKEGSLNFQKFLGFLTASNQKWACTAPVLVAGITRLNYQSNQQPNEYAWYDLGQSIAYLTLQASGFGLYVHQMGGFDREKAKLELHLPQDSQVVVMVAIGYKGDIHRIPSEFHEGELNRKTRFPLGQILSKNQWSWE